MTRLGALALFASLVSGCLEGERLDPPDATECPPVSTRVLAVKAGTYGDTGGIDPPVGDAGTAVDDTEYQLEISEDRSRVVETYRRGGRLYRVEYRATLETRRR